DAALGEPAMRVTSLLRLFVFQQVKLHAIRAGTLADIEKDERCGAERVGNRFGLHGSLNLAPRSRSVKGSERRSKEKVARRRNRTYIHPETPERTEKEGDP